ncbi:MAG: MnhB domain-containing protein [Eubacteriales bacterium]|nr:MnhB domain-containing protein [Eubacteriales bacterium]
MNNSPIVKTTAKILIPFIIVFGLYVIINGADSVGGGFQGGAVLASAFIVRWMVSPDEDIDIRYMKAAERVLLLALFLTGMLLLGRSMAMPYMTGRVWMVAVNLLIGIKVACGLTIIFYRFVFFESR